MVNFEDILLRDRSQSQRDKCCALPHEVPRLGEVTETESEMEIAKGQGDFKNLSIE